MARTFGTSKYTPEEMWNKADEYFLDCDKKSKVKTLSGLCIFLSVNKDYISEKAKDKDYSETIKQIRLIVENNIEEGLLQNTYNSTGAIFNLKNNFDWKDKSEVDNNLSGNLNVSKIEIINPN